MDKEILKTIAFFDLFDYPLTRYELWQYLNVKCNLDDIPFDNKNGFYFLPGRENIIAERMKRYNYSNEKIKIAKKIINIFKLIPYIKMIAVSNVIGAHNLREGSDIDLFIITSSKRIWLTRFFCAGLAKILNLRPTPKNKKNKICLSFYISEDHLNISDLKLNNDDLYFNYWLVGLVPIINKDNIYEKFIEANGWIDKFLPNITRFHFASPPNPLSCGVPPERGGVLGFFELLAKKIQLLILPKELKNLMNKGNNVVISDEVLKLYLVDRRQEFINKYKNKIHEIIK
jgi:hypothetical protein